MWNPPKIFKCPIRFRAKSFDQRYPAPGRTKTSAKIILTVAYRKVTECHGNFLSETLSSGIFPVDTVEKSMKIRNQNILTIHYQSDLWLLNIQNLLAAIIVNVIAAVLPFNLEKVTKKGLEMPGISNNMNYILSRCMRDGDAETVSTALRSLRHFECSNERFEMISTELTNAKEFNLERYQVAYISNVGMSVDRSS